MANESSPPQFITDEQMPTTMGTNTPNAQPSVSASSSSPPSPFLSDEQMSGMQTDDEKYGTPSQQAITALEGAARGVAGPLAPLAEKHILGVSDEDIRGRQAANPISSIGGELAGIAGSIGTGFGAGALAVKAGEAVAGGLSIGSRIGSLATKAAVENMMLSTGDEISKMVVNDPEQSFQTGLVDVGLSGILGGAVGGGLGLWAQSGAGKEATQVLKAISDKAGGVEGAPINSVDQAITQSGLDLAPEVKATLSGDQGAGMLSGGLRESSTKSGLKLQKSLQDFKSQAADGIVEALGKSPEDIHNLSSLSEFDAGTNIKKSLVDTIKQQVEPIAERFEKIKNRYSNQELPSLQRSAIADKIADLATNEGYNLSSKFPQGQLIGDMINDLPNLKTIEDLRKYTSVIGDMTYNNPELRRLGGQLKGILRGAENDSVVSIAGDKAPEAIAEHAAARQDYASSMNMLDELNDRLHVGKYSGPSSFIQAVKDMSPEDVLRRLSPKGDADVLNQIIPKFPELGNSLRDYHLGKVLQGATNRAGPDQIINPTTLFNALDKLSPEMKQFLVPAEAQSRISAIQTLLDRLPDRVNPSGTAKALDSIMGHFPASATGIGALLLGHGLPGAVTGYALGHMSKLLARDVPDAIRLGLLKFLGSSAPIEATAFKKTVDTLAATIRGEYLLNKGVANVFRPIAQVVSDSMIPTNKDRIRLDKQLDNLNQDPSSMTKYADLSGHYLPEHNQAAGQTLTQAAMYLQKLKPPTLAAGPLDRPLPPSKEATQQYGRALDIANQPLIALQKIKSGTIQPQDVVTLKTCYPALYRSMSAKMMSELTNAMKKNDTIPYTTRQGISIFFGQPMDYSMSSQGITGAQPQPAQNQPPQDQPGAMNGSKGSTKALAKVSNSAMTPGQAREKHSQDKP